MKEEVRVNFVYLPKNGKEESLTILQEHLTGRETVEFARQVKDIIPKLLKEAKEAIAKEQEGIDAKRREYQRGHNVGYVEGIKDQLRRAK